MFDILSIIYIIILCFLIFYVSLKLYNCDGMTSKPSDNDKKRYTEDVLKNISAFTNYQNVKKRLPWIDIITYENIKNRLGKVDINKKVITDYEQIYNLL